MDVSDWLIIVLFGFIFLFIFVLLKRRLVNETMKWNPFGWNLYMTTELKCEKCGWKKTRYWAKNDFINKEIDVAVYPKSQLGKHKKCSGKVYIVGIYWERKMTEAEKKYNDLCRKWGKPDGIYV